MMPDTMTAAKKFLKDELAAALHAVAAGAAVSPNLKAFLDMIAVSELGEALLAASDDGYNGVIAGSTAKGPILFESYADHPRRVMELRIKGKVVKSSAAGRYQLLARYFDANSLTQKKGRT